MKYTGQGKKNYLVIQWSADQSEWHVISKPVTFKTAMWHMMDKPHAKRDVLRVDLWENGYRPKNLDKKAA
jgi:hypothetical protein